MLGGGEITVYNTHEEVFYGRRGVLRGHRLARID